MAEFHPFTLFVFEDQLDVTAAHEMRYDDEVAAQEAWVVVKDAVDPRAVDGVTVRRAIVDVYDAVGVITLRPGNVRSMRLVRNPGPRSW